MVIDYAIEVAAHSFPLSHKRLKEHVDLICQARGAPNFPEHGVGRAVNPTTNTAWFDLLEDVLKGNRDHEFDNAEGSDLECEDGAEEVEILPENIYGTDESGFFPEGGIRVHVIGAKGKKTGHQQSDGGQENTTIIVTICTDGTSLKPAAIFKGQAYQVKWDQENPLEASLGYSKKGWTDGEIGVEYIKDFCEQTKDKVNGHTRVLLVDGHNSHYTLGFLLFAELIPSTSYAILRMVLMSTKVLMSLFLGL
ncbi:hypothetical protein M413DRAFT_12739 [Hebeloma cylindrosporum]|uniref:DDE-1 domain-containing protein n=1 Tax=Hebeloma cylindrosporum TaxID=76867 RepID=A0A0C3BPD5_HEBCY|nr:hypothetical protein M413DRAFT_12739 [Hebeloma cylindrosporum h7]